MAPLSAQSSLNAREGTQRHPRVLPDLKRLSSIFASYPDIEAVYLFGSTSTGRTHAESDLDLAVVLRPDAQSFPKLDILAKLAQAGFCNVDLVTLDTDDIVLKYEAVRQNRLIYRADDFDRGAFFSKIIRQFWDFRPFLEVQRRAYKQRTLNDQA
jgi:predicted nucleotidyltransferase